MSEFRCESTDSDFGDIRKDGSPTYSGETPSNYGFVPRDHQELIKRYGKILPYLLMSSVHQLIILKLEPVSLNCTEMNFLSSIFRSSTLFQLLVDNTQLSKIVKFSYLRTFLRGEAHTEICAFTTFHPHNPTI
ncbi:hypothetical protein PRIPAC_75616, partial [Pristionchus pacificus]|uniref:Uncharacterized protein n=1 Tax=Pristionchus pacificus TaxID=54126 RepID=A0A2A6CFR6_PRIPA